ncbi:MAG: hypothetical protein KG003_11825 [Bacteroidetes bacterium]|nr:hypothetical protein [Bacteroidota bacterium]
MDNASLNDIKKALQILPQEKMVEHFLRLAKYKKENKELLGFILFLEEDLRQYLVDVKLEIDAAFSELNATSAYYSAKGLRKILKMTNKHIKFAANKEIEADLLIHYCKKMKEIPFRIGSSVVLTNLYNRQVERVIRAIETLHEDKIMDYRESLNLIEKI